MTNRADDAPVLSGLIQPMTVNFEPMLSAGAATRSLSSSKSRAPLMPSVGAQVGASPPDRSPRVPSIDGLPVAVASVPAVSSSFHSAMVAVAGGGPLVKATRSLP